MIYSQLIEDKLNRYKACSMACAESEEQYEEDIDQNWLPVIPGLKRLDACDLKDNGYSAEWAKRWIEDFQFKGGGNDYMKFIFDYDPEDAARLSSGMSLSSYRDQHISNQMFI